MGRKDHRYHKTLHQQVYERICSMQAFGESKHAAKRQGNAAGKIYAYKTYRNYRICVRLYLRYLSEHHPKSSTLRNARTHVQEYLLYCIQCGVSSWTILTYRAILSKVFSIAPEDPDYFHYTFPKTYHKTRSRYVVVSDRRYNEERNAEFTRFCQGTGLRKHELRNLKGKDYLTRKDVADMKTRYTSVNTLSPDEQKHLLAMLDDTDLFREEHFLYIRKGKGGRARISPIVGNAVPEILKRLKQTAPDQPVWPKLPDSADIHGYRADYALTVYLSYARDPRTLPFDIVCRNGRKYQSEVCTSRRSGQKMLYDKKALLASSKALGHNRINVVYESYLYRLPEQNPFL